MKNVPPSVRKTSFNCPHCDAFAHQFWYPLYLEKPVRENRLPLLSKDVQPQQNLITRVEGINEVDPEKEKLKLNRLQEGFPEPGMCWRTVESKVVYNLFISECFSCRRISIWINDKLIYPQRGVAPPPNPDLPDDIRSDYIEASSILEQSPRGAAALLRLAIQKLCKELGQSGKNINADIAELVKEGLSQQIQQALDYVRVVGNNAVHPGQIDLRDDRETARSLFTMINLISDKMISEPKRIDEAYQDLPLEAREAIARRDDSNSQ